jgi:hypothetical protein
MPGKLRGIRAAYAELIGESLVTPAVNQHISPFWITQSGDDINSVERSHFSGKAVDVKKSPEGDPLEKPGLD